MCKCNCTTICSSWHLWIRPILILLYILFVLIVLPLLIANTVKDGFTKKDQLVLIGGLFVMVSFPICIWHIVQHALHFTKPILQKPIIRILWMVPVYALNAWFGLIYPEHSLYMNSLRECYEAYVIYNFMTYLLNFLNLEMNLEASLEYKPPQKHVFPLCCMQPWVMGREFVHNCKHGVLQYTVIRPILTFISIISEWNGVYGEGSFSLHVVFPYIVTINNISQFTAMYCLVLFYQANKDELKPMRPFPKFLCIKAVVFFSFFQSVIIDFLVYFGYIKNIFGSNEDSDDNGLSIKLQDFLICIEMFIAAIAHKYSFPHEPYHINIPDYGNDRPWFSALTAMWDMTDVQQDITEHLGVVGSSLSRRIRGRSSYHLTRGTSETDHLMSLNANAMTSSCYQGSGYNYQKTSASESDVSTATIPVHKNHYGALNSSDDRITVTSNDEIVPTHRKNDGINIVKQNQKSKDYSPQYGVPQILGNYFAQQPQPTSSTIVNQAMQSSASSSRYDRSSRSDDNTTTSKSESCFDLAAYDKAASGLESMKKSDSTASDWLSTPTDEFMGIDVKGVENDRIHYKGDPRI